MVPSLCWEAHFNKQKFCPYLENTYDVRRLSSSSECNGLPYETTSECISDDVAGRGESSSWKIPIPFPVAHSSRADRVSQGRTPESQRGASLRIRPLTRARPAVSVYEGVRDDYYFDGISVSLDELCWPGTTPLHFLSIEHSRQARVREHPHPPSVFKRENPRLQSSLSSDRIREERAGA